MATLTSEAKQLLSTTIRSLRERLLRDIHDEADRRYRLSVSLQEAGLDETHRKRRERLEAWVDERVRAAKPKSKTEEKGTRDRLLKQAEKEAAATLVNRLVVLRHMEALGLSKPAVATGGWNSKGYREFRGFAAALCTNGTQGSNDETEGYGVLLQLLFDELSVDLPGLFGDVGLTRLFPIPAAMLREVIEKLDLPELSSAWTDDTTLGWVYQYWNDPEREALDDKIADGGKIEPHEIASKTQMFTERYMVEWLLQNSLGLTWLCVCKKNGWTPDAEPVLRDLDTRRAAFRAKREAGEVALDALMPIHGELEEHWKYFVPQPIPEDAVAQAPESIRRVKLLDPATGSGHFLVIAFGLLTAMYREEAKHRGDSISDRAIAESILENNLFGIEIDPRAIQIAAAALYLKAKSLSKDARPKRLNLVAPVFQLGTLPEGDPAVVKLRHDLKSDVGIPEELTNHLLKALSGVDYLGSLFKVDAALNETIKTHEESRRPGAQLPLAEAATATKRRDSDSVRLALVEKLEHFLAQHTRSEDVGLRLDGEQLAAGVRFVRMAREGAYDVVVGNPPYQGLAKTESFGYVATTYPRGKADLYAAFLERGLQMVRAGGLSALVTKQGWMFLGYFAELREWILEQNSLRSVADLMWCAFENMRHETIAMAVLMRGSAPRAISVAIAPTDRKEREESIPALRKKRAAVLAQVGRYEFDPRGFEVIDGEPIVYWWTTDLLAKYAQTPKLGEQSAVRVGLQTSDNKRFFRFIWEVRPENVQVDLATAEQGRWRGHAWVPLLKGAAGRRWIDPTSEVIAWKDFGLGVKTFAQHLYGSYTRIVKNEDYYFRPGVAFAPIGSKFSGRVPRFVSIFDVTGSSVFPADMINVVCLLNSQMASEILSSLNPTVHFQAGDVVRLPTFPVVDAAKTFEIVEQVFARHESHRETSIEFRQPGPSSWASVQDWAQRAIDRPEGVTLPPFEPIDDAPAPEAFVSFLLGVALGRFGATGEGILSKPSIDSLPNGILFVAAGEHDSLGHPACLALHRAWSERGTTVGQGDDLRTYLRKTFFACHKDLYGKRPIYFPLSSSKKSYVAYISIHRWKDDSLQVLLADHLMPEKRRLEGEMEDIKTARAQASGKSAAERRFTEVQRLFEELTDFIDKVTDLSEKGPPPSNASTTPREVDARYTMDLDDGVMVNSAALWPVLEPQWKGPKKWWEELATARGRKDYDWSHLAARYFPTRVQKKCVEDPSLAVAHKCFWRLHPTKAHAWELRLQDEIRPEFTIDEPDSNEARARFLKEHEAQAKELFAAEMRRRERKKAKEGEEGEDGPLFDADVEAETEEASDE